jgi:hypothetical protein
MSTVPTVVAVHLPTPLPIDENTKKILTLGIYFLISMLIKSLHTQHTYSPTYSLTYPLTYSLAYSLTYGLTYSLTPYIIIAYSLP